MWWNRNKEPKPVESIDQLEGKLNAQKLRLDLREQHALDMVGKSVTWLAPLIPGLLIRSAVHKNFPELGPGADILIAYVIEILGLTSVTNTLQQWQNWQKAPAEEKRLNGRLFGAALATALIYVAINLLIVLFMHVWDLKNWALVALCLLSVIAAIGTVMRVWQVDKLKEQRTAERKADAQAKAEEARKQSEEEEQKQRRQEEQELARREKLIRLEHEQALLALQLEQKRAQADLRLEAQRAKILNSQKTKTRIGNWENENLRASFGNENENTPVAGLGIPKMGKVERRRAEILRKLQERSCTPEELEEAFGVGLSTIYRDIEAMEAANLIHKNNKGYAANGNQIGLTAG